MLRPVHASWGAAAVRRHFLVESTYLAHNVVEGIVDICPRLGRGLDELATHAASECFAICKTTSAGPASSASWELQARAVAERTLLGDLALGLQVAFVANDNDGEVVFILNAQNLLLKLLDLFKALSRCNRVHEQESLARPHVLFSHGRVFFLASGIENVE